jgi:hypothetical protein
MVTALAGSERERDGLAVVLARSRGRAGKSRAYLPQPDAGQLIEQDLVIRQGYPVVADRLAR